MFEEIIRKAWWQMFASMVANRVIREREHFLFQDGKLFLCFKPAYDQYINQVIDAGKPKELIVTEMNMKQILCTDRNYITHKRKRISKERNLYVLVFRNNPGR